MSNKWIFCLIILIITCFTIAGKATDKEIIKIKLGTLATKESDWGETFTLMSERLKVESNGQLQFQPVFEKDEKLLIEVMRTGRCDAASLTATGLGQLLSETFIFQLPMLFSTYEELDYVRNALTPQFSKMFETEGNVLLGWGDLGFIHLFSKEPIKTWADFQKTRCWAWELDPVGEKFASASGRKPVLLPIGQVLSALKKGDIQTVYASPYACLVLQWHPQVKYMSDLRLAAGVGATIINKRKYEQLSNEHKHLLCYIAKEYHEQLIVKIRERNEVSIGVLQGLLFSVELKYQIDLDKGNISEDLRQDFKDNRISLSQNATVSIEEKDSEWLIADFTTARFFTRKEKTYPVRKEGDKLNIYKQGIKVIQVPPLEKDKWLEVARQVQNGFAGDLPVDLYEKELLDKVRILLTEYRSKNKR